MALAPRPPHFAPRARNVIHLFMAGAPSQLDLFDHKPKLAEMEGKPIPPAIIGGQRYAFIRADAVQCGFCTPGQVVSAAALVAASPQPTRDEIRHAMAGNICRCGTYPKIEEAILSWQG